jgi:hypothetical protein
MSLIGHCLGIFVGVGVALSIFCVADRRRGLPLRQSLRERLPGAAAWSAAVFVWDLLPRGWHLPLAGTVGVVCLVLLFRQALSQTGPDRTSGTGAGKGAA